MPIAEQEARIKALAAGLSTIWFEQAVIPMDDIGILHATLSQVTLGTQMERNKEIQTALGLIRNVPRRGDSLLEENHLFSTAVTSASLLLDSHFVEIEIPPKPTGTVVTTEDFRVSMTRLATRLATHRQAAMRGEVSPVDLMTGRFFQADISYAGLRDHFPSVAETTLGANPLHRIDYALYFMRYPNSGLAQASDERMWVAAVSANTLLRSQEIEVTTDAITYRGETVNADDLFAISGESLVSYGVPSWDVIQPLFNETIRG